MQACLDHSAGFVRVVCDAAVVGSRCVLAMGDAGVRQSCRKVLADEEGAVVQHAGRRGTRETWDVWRNRYVWFRDVPTGLLLLCRRGRAAPRKTSCDHDRGAASPSTAVTDLIAARRCLGLTDP